MKLGNSKTENDLRVKLTDSFDDLKNNDSNKKLKAELIRANSDFKGGCVLQFIPDQGEDIYLVLTNGPMLISVEIDKYDSSVEPIVNIHSLSEYRKGLKKSRQIQLEIALEIIENKLK